MADEVVYLDHHATTPVDERVLTRMLPYFREAFGNAASRNHTYGWKAEEASEAARARVAKLIGGTTREIVFTSGATEANNLALFGVAAAYGDGEIITQATEHKAVLDPCKVLAQRGFRVTTLPVDRYGLVDPGAVAEALTAETRIVSIMFVNNEIGTVQPIAEIGDLCRRAGALFHTDATQGVGVAPINVDAMGIDLLSLSGHKIYGPKGVGALYVRRKKPRVKLEPLLYGGGHERGLRSGTLNVPAVVGLGEACRILTEEMAADSLRVRALRDRLHERIGASTSGVVLNGHPELRHPGNLNLSFADVEAEALIMSMRGVAVSSGAACASATLEPSHVLRAIGLDEELAHGSIRFGLGRFNTETQIDAVADIVISKVPHVRRLRGA